MTVASAGGEFAGDQAQQFIQSENFPVSSAEPITWWLTSVATAPAPTSRPTSPLPTACPGALSNWGPVVQGNVGKRGWMGGVGGCPNVGGVCIGCTMPGFPDKFMQLS